MKEYSGYDTEKNGLLTDDLSRTKGNNTLYVSHYFFALNDSRYLIFYYNRMHYWDKLPIELVEKSVFENLENECAVFKNFDLDGNSNSQNDFKNRIPHPPFAPSTPRIGNYYSYLGNRIVSHHKYFYFLPDWSSEAFKIYVKDLSQWDVRLILGHSAVLTKTPNYIKSIFDLKCFKKPVTSNSNTIIGAVIGDVIGSVFEWNNVKTTNFDLFNPKCDFTDDTVLTIAVADSILNKKDFAKTIWEYGRKYRGRGYGGSFRKWLQEDDLKPYGSFGNGSAMRASAVGFAFNDIETVMEVAKQSAEVTHNHPEGIKGAQATATAIFLARQGKSKKEIKDYITQTFDYNLDFTLDEIRPTYKFDVTCQGSVPQSIVAFLESSDFESAIRLAISIGGDSDTIACITGGIASAFYEQIPTEIMNFVVDRLPSEYIEIMNRFDEIYDRK